MKTTVKLNVPFHFFAVRFPNRCVYCGEASEAEVKASFFTGDASDGEPTDKKTVEMDFPFCEEHARVSARNLRIHMFPPFAVGIVFFLWSLWLTVPNPLDWEGISYLASIFTAGVLSGALGYGVGAFLIHIITSILESLTVADLRWQLGFTTLYSPMERSVAFEFDNAEIAEEFDALNRPKEPEGQFRPNEDLRCRNPECNGFHRWYGEEAAVIEASLRAPDTDNLQVTCLYCGKKTPRQDIVDWIEGERTRLETEEASTPTISSPAQYTVPEREKPASERTAELPGISSLEELLQFLLSSFGERDSDFWLTPEELCDIVERYSDILQVQWYEDSCALSEDMAYVTLFDKGKAGDNIALYGLFPFASEEAAFDYCHDERQHSGHLIGKLMSLLRIHGRFATNFIGEDISNWVHEEGYPHQFDIDAFDLWPNLFRRRQTLGIPAEDD